MNGKRCDTIFFKYFCRGSRFSIYQYLAFSDKHKSKMSKLHKIAAGAYTPMLKYAGSDIIINKRTQYNRHIGMYAGICLGNAV